MASSGLQGGLGEIWRLIDGESRSISAENPNGGKGSGGKAPSRLGTGRKGRPSIRLSSGQRLRIAEISGTGVIQHIWLTIPDRTNGAPSVLRDVILRIYWDDENEPSVEVPLGDFFCNGFAARCDVHSLPIAVNPVGGMNCYFPMPFARRAIAELESEHPADIQEMYFQFDYVLLGRLPKNSARFHAQWRRVPEGRLGEDYVIVDGVRGRGNYVGTYIGVATRDAAWWGEGEIKFYIDDDREWPTICTTGTEDYFGGAWGFARESERGVPEEVNYSGQFSGYPFRSTLHRTGGSVTSPPQTLHGLYRWHIPDPILFSRELRVTMQQIGNTQSGLFERRDDCCSVAYWYQEEPHQRFPVFPAREYRYP